MPTARQLLDRAKGLVPEAFAFGIIGAVNTLLYMAIVYALAHIGAVKANVIASVITTTLAYIANRQWTYRHRPRSALRREYTLFFGFNLIGLVIQSGSVAIAKYGFGLTEQHDLHLLMGVTVVGVGVATLFRFWAYRTFVFLKPPVEDVPVPAAIVRPRRDVSLDTELADITRAAELDAELAAELDAERRPTH